MANVLNRISKEFIASVNTPDYPISDWIINPDLSSVKSIASKYWKIDKDQVLEMNEDEKAAVDAAGLPDQKDSHIAAIKIQLEEMIGKSYGSDEQASVAFLYAQAIQMGAKNRINLCEQFFNYILSFAQYKQKMIAVIESATSEDDLKNIAFDIEANTGRNPNITIDSILRVTE